MPAQGLDVASASDPRPCCRRPLFCRPPSLSLSRQWKPALLMHGSTYSRLCRYRVLALPPSVFLFFRKRARRGLLALHDTFAVVALLGLDGREMRKVV